MSGGWVPPHDMLRDLLRKHSARVASDKLTQQGYYAPMSQLNTLRAILIANGEAHPVPHAERRGGAGVSCDPAETAGASSRALLKRQLVTGQHSIRDASRVAELLTGLAA